MKTTLEISDVLLERAKAQARKSGKTLRALVEEGLRLVLDARPATFRYQVPDRSVGKRGGPNPLESLSWRDAARDLWQAELSTRNPF